jgi:hypothetical protein
MYSYIPHHNFSRIQYLINDHGNELDEQWTSSIEQYLY